MGWFSRFDRIPDLVIREAHNKGSHTIFTYLLENGGDSNKNFGVEVIEERGDYFVRLNNPKWPAEASEIP